MSDYKSVSSHGITGVAGLGYSLLVHMNHESRFVTATDNDSVIVLKNDNNPTFRKCIISFKNSDTLSDLIGFVGRNNDATSFCGRSGVHSGVKDELWDIINDSQYTASIKPALETCHEVTCVGHSLGGALCNLFTMCANQGLENLNKFTNGNDGWDDYYALTWTKMSSDSW